MSRVVRLLFCLFFIHLVNIARASPLPSDGWFWRTGDINSFNKKLPAEMSADFLLSKVAPAVKTSKLVGVSIKSWPGFSGRYIVALCVGDGENVENIAGCQSELYFGIFEMEAAENSNNYILLARTENKVSGEVNWKGSNISQEENKCLNGDANCAIEKSFPDEWNYIDSATFKISENIPTFGMRASWAYRYAGSSSGMASALYLIAQFGKKLKVIFAAPMSYSETIEGEWNKSHTLKSEEHFAVENYLIVEEKDTAGVKNIILREKNGKWRKRYKWNPIERMYFSD